MLKHSLPVLAAIVLFSPTSSKGQVIYVATGSGQSLGEFSLSTGVAVPGFTGPTGGQYQGLALSGNTLYLANATNGRVQEYDATTGAVINSSFITGLSNPVQLTISGTTLYVANQGSSTIGAYNISTGLPLGGFTSPTGLNGPQGLAVAGGVLYVADTNLGRIGEYNASTGATINANFISATISALTISGNNLYAAGGNTVSEYSLSTGLAVGGFANPTVQGADGLQVVGNTLYVAQSHSPYGILAFDATTGNSVAYTSPSGLNGPTSLVVVPEPGSTALLSLGLSGALGVMRKRRRTA